MTKAKSTKRALISSTLATFMCVAMLIGTTFAWFTDTASTAVNTISSGNLHIEIQDETGSPLSGLEWLAIDGRPQSDILWEPGATYKLTPFKIANTGKLALKYKLVVTGLDGDSELLDVIKFNYTLNGTTLDLSEERTLAANTATDLISVSATMDKTAGNEYMDKTLDGIKINVYATQAPSEQDSFGNIYDKFAEYGDVTTVSIPTGSESDVNDALAVALRNSVTSDTTGSAKATQISLPADTTVTLNSGSTSVPSGKTKDIKIVGDKSTVVKMVNSAPGSEGSLSYLDGANLTFQGVTINPSEISGICARGGIVTFIDCKFNAELEKTIGSKFVFSDCEFTKPVSQAGYGCSDVIFDNCTFNTDGYGIKIYSEGNSPVNLTVKNSRFRNTGSAAKSAIFLDHIIDNIYYNIKINGCDFDGFTATPTPNFNIWAAREIVDSSFVKSGEQYVFSYQTGAAGGSYHKILTPAQLIVSVG